MRKVAMLIVVLVAGYIVFNYVRSAGPETVQSSNQSPASFGHAQNQSVVTGNGQVSRILPDDNRGSRHQRFIVRLSSGQTILVAHNIDLAPRVAPLDLGDMVEFKGEYVWSEKGGTLHWTHRDPTGRHAAGWLKHAGKTFQ